MATKSSKAAAQELIARALENRQVAPTAAPTAAPPPRRRGKPMPPDWIQSRQLLQKLLTGSELEAAKSLNRRCPYCDGLLIPTFREAELSDGEGGKKVRRFMTWPTIHGCPEESYQLAQVEAARRVVEAQTKRERWEKTLDRAGLVGKLRAATFDSFQPRADWPGAMRVKEAVQAWLHSFLDGSNEANWLVLYGAYGNGKSMLAAACIRAALERGLPRCYFRPWMEYLNRLKASWDGGGDEKEYQITEELQEGNLVVIDDLDKKRAGSGEWAREVIYTVLNYRYSQNLATILTFNVGPTDMDPRAPGRLALEAYLGRAIMDRIIEEGTVIEFDGPSFRSGITLGAR